MKMCPSTEADARRGFAADVLRNLLRHIDAANQKGAIDQRTGHYIFLVSHAWTEGSTMYLVYTAPPSEITWGLVRDTTRSIIDPGPWPSLDEAVLYYYLCDLEENWMSASVGHPGDPDTILWRGFPREGLPERPSDIPEAYRHTPSPVSSSAKPQEQDPSAVGEPRRYADPL
jgi:hypothetical protein